MKKILIIDDDHVICEMLKYLFEHKGYKVYVAKKFRDLFDNLQLPAVDLVLLDKRLGDLDGTLLCKKIKNNHNTSTFPVIMMSAFEKAKAACMLAGADDFVEKPFEIDKMFNKVEHFFMLDPN